MGRNKDGKRRNWLSAEGFLHGIEHVETVVSKLLSMAMLIVIFVVMIDLGLHVFDETGRHLPTFPGVLFPHLGEFASQTRQFAQGISQNAIA